jgi:hypothetical protein
VSIKFATEHSGITQTKGWRNGKEDQGIGSLAMHEQDIEGRDKKAAGDNNVTVQTRRR